MIMVGMSIGLRAHTMACIYVPTSEVSHSNALQYLSHHIHHTRPFKSQISSFRSSSKIKKPSLIYFYGDLNMSLLVFQLLLALLSSPLSFVYAFTMSSIPTARHPHCDLPGDPSLILQTNVDLGDKKSDVMKELSALVAKSLGKPESYVGE